MVSHLLKLLRETDECLKTGFNVSYIVADNYAESLKDLKIVGIVKHIPEEKTRVDRIVQRYRNIKKILKQEGNIWFINIDYWFYIILALSNIKKKKIYALNYFTFTSKTGIEGIKAMFYSIGQRKLECEFVTSKGKLKERQVYIPDFYYDQAIYKKYLCENKENRVVFCGTISRAKDVLGVVGAFSKNNVPLLICGKFESEELFRQACDVAGSNIKIENRRLEDEEYYSLLGSSAFVILPYRKENYSGRSSGVILEAVFLDTVIIAPDFLLDELEIHGLSYKNIGELERLDFTTVSKEKRKQINDSNRKIKEAYSKESVIAIYKQVFERK